MTPHVTVVVTVKDRRERMLRCVDAVLAQDHPSFEFVVVDNESRDGSYEAVQERAAGARVPMRVERAVGSIGTVHNVGARLAQGEIIAFTDSDCIPTPGWLSAGTRPFAANPGVGIVQGRTVPEPGVQRGPWHLTIEVPEFSGRYEGCNLFVRAEAFAESDGFLESVRHFWSDTVLGRGIVRRGWLTGFAPDALVHHDVTHPGMAWYVRNRALRYGDLAAAVKADPTMRDDVLWNRWFLRPESAATALAAGGLLAARRRPTLALMAAAPYLALRGPQGLTPGDVKATAEKAVVDAAILADMVRGSVRNRTLVL